MINFEERITRKSDLENNDSLSCYRGHCAQQTHKAYEIFYRFLEEVKPARILEIGTGGGGFTMFLSLTCEELGLSTKILTYDIHRPISYDGLIQRGVEVNLENVLIGEPAWHSTTQYVIDFIQQDGTTIILCDGAYKPGEFKVLSQYLKSGDIIMAHDYAENRNVFEERINKKIWNWMEIEYLSIIEPMETYEIMPYQAAVFQECAWFAGKKM